MESENIPPAPHPSQVEWSQDCQEQQETQNVITGDADSARNSVTALSDADEELDIAEQNMETATRSSKRSRKSNLKSNNKDKNCTDTSIVWTRARPKKPHEVTIQ